MSKNKNYPINPIKEHQIFFELLDNHNKKINLYKNINSDLWKTILFKLKADWTYNSNGIEGNTLNKGETIFFLQEGLTAKGKPFKDYLDTKNHAQAIDFLFDIVANKRKITEGVIKEINALLLHDVEFTPAMTANGKNVNKKTTAGKYKTQTNHVLQQDGTIHKYVEPIDVSNQMEILVKWISDNIDKHHPCFVAAIAHYNMVRIHPFDDGNGRGARILMNLILIKKGFLPAVIKVENRKEYIKALQDADNGNLQPFIDFISEELMQTLKNILSEVEKK
jgi:Fic family protein